MVDLDCAASLRKAILALESDEQCELFLRLLLTPGEIENAANRWQAMILRSDGKTVRTVVKDLGISTETVSRASRALREAGRDGKQLVGDLR